MTGPPQSGKSTLLAGMLGEARCTAGDVAVFGSAVLAPEEPWLLEDTIKRNIVMDRPWDATRYLGVCPSELPILCSGALCPCCRVAGNAALCARLPANATASAFFRWCAAPLGGLGRRPVTALPLTTKGCDHKTPRHTPDCRAVPSVRRHLQRAMPEQHVDTQTSISARHHARSCLQVLEACELDVDMQGLPDGDASVPPAGSDAVSRSQRARVSLARTLYVAADVYLLDNVLAPLDTHDSLAILRNLLLGPLLHDATVVLATDAPVAVAAADFVVQLSASGVASCVAQTPGPGRGLPAPRPRSWSGHERPATAGGVAAAVVAAADSGGGGGGDDVSETWEAPGSDWEGHRVVDDGELLPGWLQVRH